MRETIPVQADGKGMPDKGQRPSSGRKDGGESGGGSYPSPHRGQKPKDGFLGHGGQTDIDQKLKPGEPGH